ncbi:DMP19 family protein [Wielerella bovis]|uniref:DMP19 family protein n=1 Tax=Wielerella bovis TaxID=2917790 RepID=UPI0020190497|nr:DMP19 family protein [Wielerella bovis]ULJ59638.1 DMP19 family protein [Wielerella bovis]
MTPEQLFQIAAQLLDKLENEGSDALSDAQHTLLAYCWLDSQVQEGGLVQLIASGYGEYILLNPVADSLRRWRIKLTPRILDKARVLYQQYGAEIEHLVDENPDMDLDTLRQQFNQFEELDADYFDCADEDLAAICEYVATHLVDFVDAA